MKSAVIIFLSIYTVSAYGQPNLKPLSELVTKDKSTWSVVQQWIKKAKNPVVVLPKNNNRADSVLFQAQVTTRSPMGAIIYETGGILIDSGWLRILGSGNERLNRSIMDWNKGKSMREIGDRTGFLLIADDVIGGFFAINGGGIDTLNVGKVFYFSPDNIKWENTEMTYSDFLTFCFSGNLDKYYKGLRWRNWKKDICNLDGNMGINFFPFLWSKEGQKNINNNQRKVVSIQSLWDFFFNEQKNSN